MKFAWLCSHEEYQPEVLVDQAVAAEEAGFDMVLGSDHFHPWVDDTSARCSTTTRRWWPRWPRPPTGCPAGG
jgi:alkanesulfonate monooxygenase SsuD/methylene tetrahydromethanopterin reductase-like flavin-dependent oxidoreductase (luciferase family)